MRVAVLFSGWNLRAVVAFCRFCKMRQIPFIVIAKNESDPILKTDYSENVALIRKDSSFTLKLIEQVVSVIKAKGYESPVLIPSTEYLNRFLLDNRSEIEGLGCIIPVCEKEMYALLSDKESFEELCKQYSIATPEVYEEICEENIPCVIKPKKYFFDKGSVVAEKPKLVMTQEDFKELGEIDQEAYYSQQFVGGGVYYLLYYFSKEGSYALYSQKNLAQQHDGLSIVAAESSSFHNDKRVQQYTDMIRQVGFHGLVMIEIRDYNGKLYMIEANPRLWGPSQLILDSGMDLFDMFAVDCGLLSTPCHSEYKEGIKYSWFGGVVETSSLSKSLTFHNDYSAKDYLDSIDMWLKSDIYRRDDTMQLL